MRIALQKPIALLLTPALLAGCYTYTPVDAASAPAGVAVRARVSAATASRITTDFGVANARLLTGTLVSNQGDGLTIEVPSTPSGTPGAERGLFERVTVSRSDVLELETRQLDRTRTTFAVAGAAALAGVFLTTALVRGRTSGDGAVTEPPPNLSIGLLRFRF